MAHSVSVLAVRDHGRGGEILAALAEHLGVAAIRPDNGVVQLWLPLDRWAAHDRIVAALEVTADDWREHIGFR